MILTQKETSLLEDIKSQEQLCVEKYEKCEREAKDPQLKSLFSSISATERQHLDTINKILGGTVPDMQQGGCSSKEPDSFQTTYGADSNQQDKEHDKFLCSDTLATEKHVSSVYNTSVFEFKNEDVRHALYHIQGEEQHHGKIIYDYMNTNGMYC